MRSGPWRFLPPYHRSCLPAVPSSSPAFMPFLTVLSAPLRPPLRAQLPHPINAELRAGNAWGCFPSPGLRRQQRVRPEPSKQHPPGPAFPGAPSPPATDSGQQARPSLAPLGHHSGTGTSGMEPACSIADLIRTSTDGNGAQPR